MIGELSPLLHGIHGKTFDLEKDITMKSNSKTHFTFFRLFVLLFVATIGMVGLLSFKQSFIPLQTSAVGPTTMSVLYNSQRRNYQVSSIGILSLSG
jgi:hypothetical protein